MRRLARVTERHKHRLPATRGVTPALGLQDERAPGGVCRHEAVCDVVQLAAIPTTLPQVT